MYRRSVILIDNKKFNLSSLNGLNYFTNDLRRFPEEIEWNQSLQNDLVDRGDISYNGSIDLVGAVGLTSAQYYITIVKEGHPFAENEAMGDI